MKHAKNSNFRFCRPMWVSCMVMNSADQMAEIDALKIRLPS